MLKESERTRYRFLYCITKHIRDSIHFIHTCFEMAIVINFATGENQEDIYVRCMFGWNRRNDAFAQKMADCSYDKI